MQDKPVRLYLCGGPHCTPRGSSTLIPIIETGLRARGLDAQVELRVCGCQDRCDHGPNMIVQPAGVYYSWLTPDAVLAILDEHLAAGQPVSRYVNTGGRHTQGR